MTTERRPRVLLAKPGLDGHDRGVKVVALALRDAGFEVLYTGLRQSPEAIVSVAAQEAVDAIGLSILSGSHLPICERMRTLIEAAGLEDKLWIVGGNIPHADRVKLERLGVSRVFPTGTPFAEIVGYLKEQLP
jgi:methylmalonyl-CoA mutase C-terminal domain/subunit